MTTKQKAKHNQRPTDRHFYFVFDFIFVFFFSLFIWIFGFFFSLTTCILHCLTTNIFISFQILFAFAMNLWALCSFYVTFYLLHSLLLSHSLNLHFVVIINVCILNDHNKTLCILIKIDKKNKLSIAFRKQKKKKTEINVQNISAHWMSFDIFPLFCYLML